MVVGGRGRGTEKMFTEPRYRRVLSERVHPRATSTKRIFIKSPRDRPCPRGRGSEGGGKLHELLAEPLNGRRYPSSSPTPLGPNPFLRPRLPESLVANDASTSRSSSASSDLRRIIIYVSLSLSLGAAACLRRRSRKERCRRSIHDGGGGYINFIRESRGPKLPIKRYLQKYRGPLY